MTTSHNQTDTARDYDVAGRASAIDKTVKQAAEEFDLTAERIADALHTLDLLAAAAWTVGRATKEELDFVGPPFDLVKKYTSTWALSDAETLRLAYDLVNKLHNRASVL